MKIRNTIAFLAVCVCFACKKEVNREEVDFPLTLHLQGLVKKTDVRLYTANGEIKDPAIINQFINKEKDYFVTPEKFTPDDSKITFLSRDTIIFNGNDKVKFSVVREGDLFLFYSNIFPGNEALINQIFKYQAKKTPIPNWSGYSYMTQEVRAGRGVYHKLSLSRTSYKLKQTYTSTQGNSVNAWSGIIFNEIADNITSKLGKQGTQDTLAVLESTLVFVR